MIVDWDRVLPRLVHDAKALLRAPHCKAQLLGPKVDACNDPQLKLMLDSVIAGHRDLAHFLNRLGQFADALGEGSGARLPLNSVVLGVKLASRDAFAAAGGQMECSVIPDCSVPSRLQIALQELADNTVRFRAPDRSPSALLQCESDRLRLRLEYRDNGIGWDPAYTGRLFEPFERLDAERSGHGLGLAMARAIVEGCGGSIRADTSPCGSQFLIELPLAPSG